MSFIGEKVEQYHKGIIVLLVLVIGFFLAACTFHDLIPVCHYLFGCDHNLHANSSTDFTGWPILLALGFLGRSALSLK